MGVCVAFRCIPSVLGMAERGKAKVVQAVFIATLPNLSLCPSEVGIAASLRERGDEGGVTPHGVCYDRLRKARAGGEAGTFCALLGWGGGLFMSWAFPCGSAQAHLRAGAPWPGLCPHHPGLVPVFCQCGLPSDFCGSPS